MENKLEDESIDQPAPQSYFYSDFSAVIQTDHDNLSDEKLIETRLDKVSHYES